MIKRDLLKLRPLKATPKMMRMAADDIPKKETYSCNGYTYTRETVQHDLFLRCAVQAGILKVSLFIPNIMRLGSIKPAFDVFIDRAAKKFLTFDYDKSRWLTGKLDRIDWETFYYSSADRWISKADAKKVQEYLGSKEGSYWAILDYQRGIRAEELKRRHKRQTDPWDADLAQIPALPKDWDRWVAKVGIPEHYIFYRYTRKGADSGYCTYCEKEVPIKAPRHNKKGRCPCCRHTISFKSIGKAGRVWTKERTVYLMQRCADGFTIRCFKTARCYPPGEIESPIQYCHEIRRGIYDCDGHALKAYYWGTYKQVEDRWIKTSVCSPTCWGFYGRVYGKTLPDLSRRGLSRTGVLDYIRQDGNVDPEKYLAVLERVPQLEQIAKVGLSRMVNECLEAHYSFKEKLASQNATSLTGMLGINAQELKRLRVNNGGTRFLAWLRFEKGSNRLIPDWVISWFCSQKVTAEDLKFIRDRMSIVQICHYMKRQLEDTHYQNASHMLTTWADYLSMAVRFHLDVNNEIVFRAKNLRQRHDELVARSNQDKDLSVQIGEVMQAHPQVEAILPSLVSKYGYAGDKYLVVVPTSVEEIIQEGRYLNHCIASSKRYWERIERGESYLMFLRKTSSPQTPYYTMEVEPGGTVRQLRTFYDNQNDDVIEARGFLREWQAVVAKRITEEDRQAAAVSQVLRNQEFKQMRQDNVIIYTGNLAGQRLVDVLTADLMEAAA